MIDLVAALGLVFVIEGIMISLFPDLSKKMMMQMMSTPDNHLKIVGIISALFGLTILTIAKGFN